MKYEIDFEHNPVFLNNFLSYLTSVKNYSKYTVKAYENDLKGFLTFILAYKKYNIELKKCSLLAILQIGEDDIIAFLTFSNYSKNNCAKTRQRKLTSIKALFKWIAITHLEIRQNNPTKKIPNIQPTITIPKYLSLENAKKIQCAFNESNCKTPIRNNCIISLFLSTGMRISELSFIRIKDIDFKNNSIKVIGKGNKQRIVYFSDRCKKLIERYVSIERLKINDADFLFLNYNGYKLSNQSIEKLCKSAFKLIGMEKYGYSAHTLRHTAATIMYHYSNVDILLLKEILGHSTIVSTQIYSHIYNSKIKTAYEKNPLSNYKMGGSK